MGKRHNSDQTGKSPPLRRQVLPDTTPIVELHCAVKHFIHGAKAVPGPDASRPGEPGGRDGSSLQYPGLVRAGNRGPGDVQGLSLMVRQGEILVLLGPSGCGKTTTLRLIAGFEQPDGGTVRIKGQLVADKNRCLPPEKRGLGMVFQDYALFPHLTVAENVGFGLHRLSRHARRERITEVLSLVELTDLAGRYPHALSGGQQQRVALARALAPWPSVILFDEPFSNLDAELRTQVRMDVRRILKDNGSTALFVTHDQQEALMLGDQVAVMRRGFVEQIDTPERIFHQPLNRFVADFLGAADFLPGQVGSQGLETEIGVLPPAHRLEEGLQVDVLVRPHDLQVQPVGAETGTSHGFIEQAEYAGDHWQYLVRLHSGRYVRCFAAHTDRFAPGTSVRVELSADHGLVCFLDGRALTA